MREIKFRAWNPQFKEMFYSIENDGYDESRHFSPFIFDIGTKCGWAFYHFNLMQFTGLKDKNKIDIYEGDVVKWTERHGAGLVTYKSPVEYEHDCFCISGYQINNQGLYSQNHVCEIIGNIYQTPELLTIK